MSGVRLGVWGISIDFNRFNSFLTVGLDTPSLFCYFFTNMLLQSHPGRVARSMVSANHWLSWIKTYI